MNGIVGTNMDAKIVRAIHPRMHGKAHHHGGFFSGFECRRTDDSGRWSTTFDDLNPRFAGQDQFLIANIAQ